MSKLIPKQKHNPKPRPKSTQKHKHKHQPPCRHIEKSTSLCAVFVVPHCSLREREREREKCLESEKMKENENPKTLKRLRAFLFYFINGKGWVEFEYIIFGLNGDQ